MKTTDEMIQSVLERRNQYEKTKTARRKMLLGCICALCCLGLAVSLFTLGGIDPKTGNPAESYRVLIDVNPSIELCADERDVVTNAKALNSDGEKILERSEIKDKSLDEAVKNMCEAMVEMEYISEEANSVLVSVEGLEGGKNEKIKESLAQSISQSLADKKVEGAIILQTISESSELNKLAETYNISAGKAKLISQIIDQNKFHTYEELSALSIHELNILKTSYYIQMEDTKELGTPGQMAYIGKDRAEEIAVRNANITVGQTETVLECRAGMMVYCITFENATHEYRYYVNAVTGEILTGEKKEIGKDDFHTGETDDGFVGENAALAAALAHAGMEDSTLTWCKFNRDWVDGLSVYNIFFTDGLFSGRYVVNARTGEVIQNSKTQEPKDRSVKASVIGHVEAKRIALSKDGLIDGNVSKYEVELLFENNSYVYSFSFICNGAKYNALVDAVSGTVLNFEKNVLKETGAPSVEDASYVSPERGSSASQKER